MKKQELTAKDILGNPDFQAISYEGYRENSREIQPSVAQLKEDLEILSAMGIKILRTYNVQFAHASNLLQAIREMKEENSEFEMYVMLGAWIDCKNAWTDMEPDHYVESEQNEGEIERAVALVNKYADIVKVLAIGNEAMVKWATSYHVQPSVILKWVNYVQDLKKSGHLPAELWVTSSDDFSSWGGGDTLYHTEDLKKLAQAVDYISIHTYPYHNTHYNPAFWNVPHEESHLSEVEKVDAAMVRARDFAKAQYDSVLAYMQHIGIDKPIHIGETGWASTSDGFYGIEGSRATDEYKQGKYYQLMREWTDAAGISCFYFEAFNEPWKDAKNAQGSENHFGLFSETGLAKYAIWDLVDQGVFDGLTRDGNPIIKTFGGNKEELFKYVQAPPAM
ncbi:glycosyl hydrolase family 17 protein [Belliella kenyensis]|uniref:Endo-1,3-beta-glucanase btgC n=1 Tax=Belliella kenyensis TaxID=1472724 RepID=A0ABV8EK88_9BACT|nr:glycosyl hydrolase family 17 protein [Belliella kenyensis]MCH7400421.1 glycosyl hydrolase family 17 protein [Belliella kenyensis]MDN3604562.1 glycosyl hydrolase family 17 protein [Belliella kenyensis]